MAHQKCSLDSQLGPMGGYSASFLVTLGSQVHHSDLLMPSMTLGTCMPQPNQVAFSVVELVRRSPSA